jgi:hypothetical protein
MTKKSPFRIVALMTAVLAVYGSAGCVPQDVTESTPEFHALVGHCFVLRQDVFLLSESILWGPYYVARTNIGGTYTTVKSCQAHRANEPWNTPVLGIVRAGTRFRVLRLIDTHHLVARNIGYAVLLDGEFRNDTVYINDLFGKEFFAGDWLSMNEQYIAPCDDSGK